MPLLPETQQRRLLTENGYDPTQFTVDTEGNVRKRVSSTPPAIPNKQYLQQVAPTTQQAFPPAPPLPSVTFEGQQPPSNLESLGRAAAGSLLPTGGGLAGAAAGGALGAAMGGGILSPLTGILGTLAGGIGTSYLQDLVLPDEFKQKYFLRPEDIQENPVISTAGTFAPSLLAFNPLTGIRQAAAIPGMIGRRAAGGTLGATERNILAQAGIGGGLEAGVEAGQQFFGEGELDPSRIALAGLLGTILNEPNKLIGQGVFGFQPTAVPNQVRFTPRPEPTGARFVADPTGNIREAGRPVEPQFQKEATTTPEPEAPKKEAAPEAEIDPSKILVRNKASNDQDLLGNFGAKKEEVQKILKREVPDDVFSALDEDELQLIGDRSLDNLLKRGFKVEIVTGLTDAQGNKINGYFDPDTQRIVLNRSVYADTILHETNHGWVNDLRNSKSKRDQKLVKRAQEILGENWMERLATIMGQRGAVRTLTKEKAGIGLKVKEFFKDVFASAKQDLGVASDEDVMRVFTSRQDLDAPFGQSIELSGMAGTAVTPPDVIEEPEIVVRQEDLFTAKEQAKGRKGKLKEEAAAREPSLRDLRKGDVVSVTREGETFDATVTRINKKEGTVNVRRPQAKRVTKDVTREEVGETALRETEGGDVKELKKGKQYQPREGGDVGVPLRDAAPGDKIKRSKKKLGEKPPGAFWLSPEGDVYLVRKNFNDFFDNRDPATHDNTADIIKENTLGDLSRINIPTEEYLTKRGWKRGITTTDGRVMLDGDFETIVSGNKNTLTRAQKQFAEDQVFFGERRVTLDGKDVVERGSGERGDTRQYQPRDVDDLFDNLGDEFRKEVGMDLAEGLTKAHNKAFRNAPDNFASVANYNDTNIKNVLKAFDDAFTTLDSARRGQSLEKDTVSKAVRGLTAAMSRASNDFSNGYEATIERFARLDDIGGIVRTYEAARETQTALRNAVKKFVASEQIAKVENADTTFADEISERLLKASVIGKTERLLDNLRNKLSERQLKALNKALPVDDSPEAIRQRRQNQPREGGDIEIFKDTEQYLRDLSRKIHKIGNDFVNSKQMSEFAHKGTSELEIDGYNFLSNLEDSVEKFNQDLARIIANQLKYIENDRLENFAGNLNTAVSDAWIDFSDDLSSLFKALSFDSSNINGLVSLGNYVDKMEDLLTKSLAKIANREELASAYDDLTASVDRSADDFLKYSKRLIKTIQSKAIESYQLNDLTIEDLENIDKIFPTDIIRTLTDSDNWALLGREKWRELRSDVFSGRIKLTSPEQRRQNQPREGGDIQYQANPEILGEENAKRAKVISSSPKHVKNQISTAVSDWFLGAFGSAIDKLEVRFKNPTANYVAKKLRDHALAKSWKLGPLRNQVIEMVLQMDKNQRARVDQYAREMDQHGKSTIKLTTAEKSLYKNIRDWIRKVAEDNPIREIEIDENYWPNILSQDVVYRWNKYGKEGSIEAKRNSRLYINHMREGLMAENPDWSIQKAEKRAVQMLDDLIGHLSKDRSSEDVEFGPLRKAARFGLPIELQDNNIYSRLRRYGQRAANDLAFFEVIESDPIMMRSLGIKYKGKKGRDVPELEELTLPDGSAVDGLEGQAITNIKKFLFNDFREIQQPVLKTWSKAVNNTLLGTATAVRNTIQAPLNVLPNIRKMEDLRLYATVIPKLLFNYRKIAKQALGVNAVSKHLADLEFDSALAPNRWLRRVNQFGNIMRQLSGREGAERFERVYEFAMGQLVAEMEFSRAIAGDKNAIKWLKKFGGDLIDIDTKLKKAKGLHHIKDDDINLIAKAFTDRAAGTYDERGLPAGIMEGNLSPFFALSRWSFEKSNVVFKDVIQPLIERGDVKPFLTYTLGALATGVAIDEVSEWMNNRTKSIPKWKEAWAAGDKTQMTRAAINLFQLSAYVGIVSDILRTTTEVYHGKMPQGIGFPLVDFIADGVTQNLADFSNAVQQGENPVELLPAFVGNTLTSYVQAARILNNHFLSMEESKRKDQFRDLRVFKELEGMPGTTVPPELNPYLRRTEKEFKRTTDIQEAITLFPDVVKRRLSDAYDDNGNFDAEKFYKGIRSARQNSFQVVPNPKTSPAEFLRYYQFLVETQGQQKADQRVAEYVTQNQLNKFKAQLFQ